MSKKEKRKYPKAIYTVKYKGRRYKHIVKLGNHQTLRVQIARDKHPEAIFIQGGYYLPLPKKKKKVAESED